MIPLHTHVKAVTMTIPRLGGTWTLYVQDSEDESIPVGSNDWDYRLYTPHHKTLIGYVKRYGRSNSGTATWHVVPFTSARDGTKQWALYVS